MPEEKEVRFAFVSCCSGASTLDQSSDLGTRIVEVSKSPPAPSARSGNGRGSGLTRLSLGHWTDESGMGSVALPVGLL